MRISDWSSDVCSSDLEAIIDGLQVTVPGGYEGTISGTITTTSTEANTTANTVPESGQEPDTNDNSRNDSVDFAVRIRWQGRSLGGHRPAGRGCRHQGGFERQRGGVLGTPRAPDCRVELHRHRTAERGG